MSNILEVKDLNVSYGGIKAVKDISFSVPKGEVVTLIGANGAGKSSTLRSIVGLVKPESGSILLKGEELAGVSTEQIVTKGITLVPVSYTHLKACLAQGKQAGEAVQQVHGHRYQRVNRALFQS